MKKIFLLSQNVFKELIRKRALAIFFIFSIALIFASISFGFLSAEEERKFVLDMGLACVSIFSVLLAIFGIAALIPSEIERKTVEVLFSKPLSRWDFIFSKLLGGIIFIVLAYLLMSIALVSALAIKGIHINFELAKVLLIGSFEPMVIAAVAIFASIIFASPIVSSAFTFFVYIMGHLNATISHISEHSFNIFKNIGVLSNMVIPNLEVFNLREALLIESTISNFYIMKSFLFALSYIIAFSFFSGLIFNKKEL